MEYKIKCNQCEVEVKSDQPWEIVVDQERVEGNEKRIENREKRDAEEEREQEEREDTRERMEVISDKFHAKYEKKKFSFWSSSALISWQYDETFENFVKEQDMELYNLFMKYGYIVGSSWNISRPGIDWGYTPPLRTRYWECPMCGEKNYI